MPLPGFGDRSLRACADGARPNVLGPSARKREVEGTITIAHHGLLVPVQIYKLRGELVHKILVSLASALHWGSQEVSSEAQQLRAILVRPVRASIITRALTSVTSIQGMISENYLTARAALVTNLLLASETWPSSRNSNGSSSRSKR